MQKLVKLLKSTAFLLLFTLLIIGLSPRSALAWNGRGHRLVAWMAFEQLDEKTRNKLAEILRQHPAEKPWWRDARFNPRDARLALFVNASVFPDLARPDTEFSRYFRPGAHYINYRLVYEANKPPRLEPPRASDENVVNTYIAHLKTINERKNTPQERAVALSWVIHQVADIHQPLHATARFCPATPNGDKGGNDIEFPNDNGPDNLHAYWDGVLGREENPPSLDREAKRLLRELPREKFTKELAKTGGINDWVRESAGYCQTTVYSNLSINEKRFRDLPIGYAADARKLSEKQVTLAAYRLADVLKKIAQETP
jgi:hypothetical protein